MKSERFRSVTLNNRKRQIACVYTNGKKIILHLGQLGIRKNVIRVWVDRETGGRSVGFEFSDGSIDYMPYDQPLFLTKEPEFLLQTHIEDLTSRIKSELKKQGISKRYLATRLGTSDNQIQRLLDPKILNKNLEQLYKIAALLGCEFEWKLTKAA